MKKLFPIFPSAKQQQAAALCFGFFLAGTTAHGQATSVYGLSIATAAYTTPLGTIPVGTEFLTPISPSSPGLTLASTFIPIGGIGANQQLVGLDVRPNTGQLYALGYNNAAGTTPNAQLYLISIAGSAATATAVGNPITLDLGTSARTDLNNGFNLIIGVGFDFNPRADRIRVTGQNGMNYRLSPVTGQVVATDSPLVYAATGNVVTPPSTPDIGSVAYTNSALGLTGTALYDVDQTPNKGILASQSIVANTTTTNGTLTSLANLTLTGTSGTFGIGDSNFDVDIYTDPATKQNTAYLLELTGPTAGSKGSSNLYSLNLGTGNATLLGNITGGTPIRFINIAAALAPAPAVWTGKVDTNWGTAGNWSTNVVPTSSTDVFIPGSDPVNVPNQPTVSTAQQARSVVLSTGSTGTPAILTLAANGILSVSGNFANNDGSIAPSSTGTLALVGSANQDISGPSLTQFPNLSVGSSGATLSGPAAVQGGLTLAGNLAISSPFTLLSNASGTAYVVNSGGVATGTATVQRYITPSNTGLGYRHYSAPVSNTTVNDLATSSFTPIFNTAYNTSTTPGTTTPFPTVYGYSQAQYEGSPATTITTDFDKGFYSPASGDAWKPGTGYTVNLGGSELVDFVGSLTTGPVTTDGQGRSAKANAGWQLLGNPYPSSLDWDKVASNGLVNIRPTLYVFKSSGQFGGSYASYLNGVGTNGGTNVVPVAQGFFVQTSAVGATGNINFTDGQRITSASTAPFQRTAADTRPQLLLELGNGTLASQTDIYFEQGATAGLDNAFDATALPSLNGLILASEAGSDVLAINGQPALSAAVTVPLRVAVATAGTYSLRAADLANLPAGYHAYLRDASLNTYTDLATTPSISLNLASGTATGRFAVVFTNASPLATAPAALAALASVYPSPASGKATLVLPQALRGNGTSTVQLLNTLGQAVLTRTVAPGSTDAIELPLTGLAAGIYTVRATTVAGQVAKRLVIE